MPDINFGEWMILAVIALVVVGPRNLPDLSRKLGGWMREARAMATDFRVGLEREIADLDEIRADLKGIGEEVAQPLKEAKGELGSVSKDLKPLDWNGPIPSAGPTPADSAEDFKKIHGLPADEDSDVDAGDGNDGEPIVEPEDSVADSSDPETDEGVAKDSSAGEGSARDPRRGV